MSKLIKEHKLGAVFLYKEIDDSQRTPCQFEDYKVELLLAMPDQIFSREKQAEDLHLLLNQLQSYQLVAKQTRWS